VTVVTLTGSNFTGATAVKFNGISVASFTVQSATTLIATVPAGATTGPLSVTTANGIGTSTTTFYVGNNLRDGAPLSWVPSTSNLFTMGTTQPDLGISPGPTSSSVNETQQVTLTGFWIYTTPVTVAQYCTFCAVAQYNLPPCPWPGIGWTDWSIQQWPMTNVSWDDASAYAAWAGATLPTEAQYEYAARGPQENSYPWGEGWDRTRCINSVMPPLPLSPSPVGSCSPAGNSWCGAEDLAGNVWEWCQDWWEDYSSTPVTNPCATDDTSNTGFRVLRGGSWYETNEQVYLGAHRGYDDPTVTAGYYGFRCAVVAPGPTP